MQGYYDVVVNTGGAPVDGASVFVYDASGALATIYQSTSPIVETVLTSNGTPYYLSQDLVTPQVNPITTGADGRYIFFAENGVYTVVITANGYNSRTFSVTLYDTTTRPSPTYSVVVTPPNDAVNVSAITANVATLNGDFVLAPKGSGALLSMIPDNTTAGGNKRGAFAVDWQRETFFADYVATGDYSVVGGGFTSRASGAYSVVGGGAICSATGDWSAVAGGFGNMASGRWTFVAGASNEASGDQAVIAGGASNIASGTYATISGGAANLASGNYSTVVGGTRGSTRGIVGYTAIPASNSPIQTKVGVSQAGVLVLGAETTSAAGVVLRSNSSAASASNQLVLADNSACFVSGTIIATVTGGGNAKCWQFTAQLKRGVGAASTVITNSSTSSPYGDAGAATWSMGLGVNVTSGALTVTVFGQASTTIRWVCRLETTEVSY